MFKNEVQKYFVFKRNLILQGNLSKTITFKKCEFYFDRQKHSIDFSQTFHQLVKKNPDLIELLDNTQLFHIDQAQQKNHFLGNFPLKQDVFVQFNDWEATNITLSYRNLNEKQKQSPHKLSQSCKKSKERSIAEVTACIQQWRKEFIKSEETGKFLSRMGAAKNIGMNKKTLDDYARCLKFGEQFGFDFEKNSNQKISVLRNFVKEKRSLMNIHSVQFQDPNIFLQSWELQDEFEYFEKFD